MSKKKFFSAFFSILSTGLIAQYSTLELEFTALNNSDHVQIDSIKVINRTLSCDTVLYYPDTVLVLEYWVGLSQFPQSNPDFRVFQNYPNPAADQTTISVNVPEKDNVSLVVTDLTGRLILKSDRVLEKGIHTLRLTLGNANLYFFKAFWRASCDGIKILHIPSGTNPTVFLEYQDAENHYDQLKTAEETRGFNFSLGNNLFLIGYSAGLESGIPGNPDESQLITFQFATNIPCPGIPTVDYDGQVYNTIQVFSQCWLKENLNVGTMIPGGQNQSNNGILEKYCYNDVPDSCAKNGGLYLWDEMMQYFVQQGVQGICPPGWHLPTNDEWKILEGAVDNQYGIGDLEWELADYRGFDAGANLKTTEGWYGGGDGSDLFGFSCKPSGCRVYYGDFTEGSGKAYYWTSTESNTSFAISRSLSCYLDGINKESSLKWDGNSVRCLKDY